MPEFAEIMRQARRLCAAHGGICNYSARGCEEVEQGKFAGYQSD